MVKRNVRDWTEAKAYVMPLIERPLSDEDCSERWNESEAVIEQYIAGVEARSSIPSRQELGEACFWLIYLTKLISSEEHSTLAFELLSPSFGLELLSLLPRVAELRDEALTALERMATQEAAKPSPLLDEELPF